MGYELNSGRSYLSFNPELPSLTKNPSFGEVWRSQMNINYTPWANWANNIDRFGEYRDVNWTEDVINKRLNGIDAFYLPFKSSLMSTNTQEHYEAVKKQIDDMNFHRKVASEGSIWQHLMTGVLDPINVLALPIGGPISSSFLKQGARTAISAMTPITAVELGSHAFDPTRTTRETAFNIAAGTAFTFAFGGMFSFMGKRRDKIINKANEDYQTYVKDINSVSAEVMRNVGNRQNRTFANIDDNTLFNNLEELTKKLHVLDEFIKANTKEGIKFEPINFDDIVPNVKYEVKLKGQGEFEGKAPAHYNRESNTIFLSMDGLEKKFADKAWTKPRVKGVKALPENSFKTFDDWLDFVKMHELMHAKYPKGPKESKARYENRMNRYALNEIKKQRENSADVQRADLQSRIDEIDGEMTVRRIEAMEGGEDIWRYKDNWFINSPIFNMVTTPAKRIFQNKNLKGAANYVKAQGVLLFGDMGVTHRANVLGLASGLSVHNKSAVTRGEWVAVYDELVELYGKHSGQPVARMMDVQIGRKKDMTAFMEEANRKRIFGERGKGEAERKAISVLDNYFKTWERRLIDSGMIDKGKGLLTKITKLENKIALLESKVATAKLAVRKSIDDDSITLKTRSSTEEILEEIKIKKQELERLNLERENTVMAEEAFFPRYWNQDYIRRNREDFISVLVKYFKENPEHWVFDKKKKKYIKVKYKGKDLEEKALIKRANEATDNILAIKDVTDVDNLFLGKGLSGHLKFRALDIPNHLVYKFIQHDPMQILKVYNQRIAPKFHMYENFGTTNKTDFLTDLRAEMVRNNVDEKTIRETIRDFDALYRRVHGTILEEPDRWHQKTRRFVTETAQLTYLGTAGLASLTDFAKIVMEHNMGDIFKVLFNMMDNQKIVLNAKEGRIAGEILEILQSDSHLRFSENVINNPFANSFLDKALNKTRNTFFFANALAPLTNIAKRMDSMIRTHSIIEMAVQINEKGWKSLTRLDQEKLLRYGLDEKTMRIIAKAPFERTDLRKVKNPVGEAREIGGLYLGNTEAWVDAGIPQETVTKFRAALNQGIQNTIMLGTPADKPIAVDGVFYVPIKVAKAFGYKEDKIVKGYARVEQGLGALPFQFYSYSFAAMNKVTGAFAHSAVKNRIVSIVAAMGLGYMGLSLKNYNRPWAMENMSMEDKIARSFDMSGLAALYSDAFYTVGGMVKDGFDKDMMATFGLQRKGPDGNAWDAVTGFTGAGTSWSLDALRAMRDFYNGDWTEGATESLRLLPFQNTIFFRDDISWLSQQINKSRF